MHDIKINFKPWFNWNMDKLKIIITDLQPTDIYHFI